MDRHQAAGFMHHYANNEGNIDNSSTDWDYSADKSCFIHSGGFLTNTPEALRLYKLLTAPTACSDNNKTPYSPRLFGAGVVLFYSPSD